MRETSRAQDKKLVVNNNTDYSDSDNEGHIFFKLTNESRDGKTVTVKRGEAFAQGVILQYFITEDDSTEGIRNGGFGSTTNK